MQLVMPIDIGYADTSNRGRETCMAGMVNSMPPKGGTEKR